MVIWLSIRVEGIIESSEFAMLKKFSYGAISFDKACTINLYLQHGGRLVNAF